MPIKGNNSCWKKSGLNHPSPLPETTAGFYTSKNGGLPGRMALNHLGIVRDVHPEWDF